MRYQIALLVTMLMSLTACIPFPRYALVQPNVKIQVKENSGKPISAAKVIFIAASHPHAVLRKKQTIASSAQGYVELTAEHEWEAIYPLMMHGVPEYFWALCIEKEGYISSGYAINPQQQEYVVILRHGISSPCKNDNGYLYVEY